MKTIYRSYTPTPLNEIIFCILGIFLTFFVSINCTATDEPINPNIAKAVDYYTHDVISFDGNNHKLYLGISRSEVVKIMNNKNWNKKLDERWTENHEQETIKWMKSNNFSDKDIANTIIKNHGKSALLYTSVIKLNPISIIPMKYYFRFDNDKLIDYELTFLSFFPVGNDGGNNILTEAYQEIYKKLGAPDSKSYLEIGTAGIWTFSNNKEIITLKGVPETLSDNEIKEIIQEHRDLNAYLRHQPYRITIHHYFNPNIQKFSET